jgi:hypothetical protein
MLVRAKFNNIKTMLLLHRLARIVINLSLILVLHHCLHSKSIPK